MKLRLLLLLTGILFAGATLFAWLLAGPATRFEEPRNYLFIRTGAATQEEVMQTLRDSSFIRNTGLFAFLANRLQVWPRLRPGKYVIEKGTSLLQLARKLRNQQQEPVNLVVVKLRTNRQFAGLVGRRFECDSLRFLTFISNPDSTRNRGVDSTTLLSIVLPDTYTYYWSATPAELLEKLAAYHQKFWNAQRKQRADSLGLSPLQITVLASIVEEETLRDDEKPLIASVYLNRLRRGMPLGADPTVKYATGDFTLRRILFKHIQETAASPY
ncbi:MAG TPA: endolytic transglycosylase MltG, partial [Lacibacter sp.]|nr:endolytic transglycosylase MltG [Lacibacter sp.]